MSRARARFAVADLFEIGARRGERNGVGRLIGTLDFRRHFIQDEIAILKATGSFAGSESCGRASSRNATAPVTPLVKDTV